LSPAARSVGTTLLLAVCGLYFLAGGALLAIAGGSWFYLFLGTSFLAQAWLLWRRSSAVHVLAGLSLCATIVWSLWEVGLDVWGLEVRLAVPTIAALWLLLPPVRRSIVVSRMGVLSIGIVSVAAVIVVALGTAVLQPFHSPQAPAFAKAALHQPDSPAADWRAPGGSLGADRFSRLQQLTPQNVHRLKIAWIYHTGASRARGDFEATPLKIGAALYICSSKGVAAVDADSGHELWHYEPPPGQARANDAEASGAGTCRGLSYYQGSGDGLCAKRLFEPTRTRVIALDLQTGKPCTDFGANGILDTLRGLGESAGHFVSVTSAPLVIGERLIIGQSVSDSQFFGEPAGGVRAYDVHSGQLLWAWDVGRVPSNKPLARGEIYTPDTPNVWGPITGDPALGLAYVPTGVTTPDYFGGQRKQYPFDDAYSTSIVALDVATGLERWRFQTVHHDLWDMDVPTGPSLVDLPRDGAALIPALVQSTKLGELFVLDRRTGKPIYEVTEKSVPQGDVPGEYYAPTQPYVTGAQSLRPSDLREADSWGATLFDQMLCRIQFRQLDYKGAFTPPSLRGALVFPGYFGVSDWSGVALDPSRQIVIQNRSYMPWTAKLYRREDAEAKGWVKPWDGKGATPKRGDPTIRPQYFTPYVLRLNPWLNIIGVPCKAPPFGELAGYDLRAGKLLWKEVLGDSRHSAPFGLSENFPLPTGMYSVGGAVVTASGLTFIAATADRQFRAFETATGRELWHADLPFGGHASPMTYLGKGGRQYVAVAAGGNWGMRDAVGDALVAFALEQ
jgi:quinoprotein glucose dehydrogenase